MVRVAALMIVIGGTVVAGPAAAQFGNIFGDAPPRPPADIPNGPFPPQPPPIQYPRQAPPAYPTYPPAPPSPSSIEVQSLPPPPAASVAPAGAPGPARPQRAPAPVEHATTTPPPNSSSNPPPNSAAPPALAETPAPDDVVIEAPTQHIDNGRAVFSGLDKITGRTISFDAAIGETVQFGALQVTPRVCYTRPPTEATNTDAFVEVDEVTLQGEIKRIFTGWMFASSPGLHAVEHPIYDVWLTNCSSPVQTSLAEPVAPATAAPAAAKPRHSAPTPAATTRQRSGTALPATVQPQSR